jgi:hypothetical protein
MLEGAEDRASGDWVVLPVVAIGNMPATANCPTRTARPLLQALIRRGLFRGERDAAALAADRLVRGRGLDWLTALGGVQLEQPMSQPGWTPSPSPVPTHVGDLQACGRRLDLLTPWETAFG